MELLQTLLLFAVVGPDCEGQKSTGGDGPSATGAVRGRTGREGSEAGEGQSRSPELRGGMSKRTDSLCSCGETICTGQR